MQFEHGIEAIKLSKSDKPVVIVIQLQYVTRILMSSIRIIQQSKCQTLINQIYYNNLTS